MTRRVLAAILLSFIVSVGVTAYVVSVNFYNNGFNDGGNYAYPIGYTNGRGDAYTDVQQHLLADGFDFNWQLLPNGTYSVTVTGLDNAHNATSSKNFMVTADVIVQVWNSQGQLKDVSEGAGVFTDLGKNYTLEQWFTSYTNASQTPTWISQSTSSAGLSATSTILPSELAADGLSRSNGTYNFMSQVSGSTWSWNVTASYTVVTLGQTVVVWGLSFGDYTGGYATWGLASAGPMAPKGAITAGNNLIAYDTTPGSKNMAIGDTEAVTWLLTIV